MAIALCRQVLTGSGLAAAGSSGENALLQSGFIFYAALEP